MTTLATRIDESWSRLGYFASVAEVRCAAALAATGHLTSVEDMKLENLEVPSSQDMLSLAEVVNTWVWLNNVTGDIVPLVSSLACTLYRVTDIQHGSGPGDHQRPGAGSAERGEKPESA